jgi:AcrR family transcriptional regulator
MKHRGRPRDTAIDDQVRATTLNLLADVGRAGTTVEAVAAASGVAKTTIYRRWSGRDELIMGALAVLFEAGEEPTPSDDPRLDLVALLGQLREQWADPRFRRLMRRLSSDGSEAPRDYQRFREQLIAQRRGLLLAVLRRCVEAGHIRDDVDLRWAADLLVAPVIVAAMTHRDDVTASQLDFSVDIVLRGLAPG